MKAKPKYKPVPVDIAKGIADMFAKSQVVILCYDPVHQLTHTTTYGREAFDKENAAAAGELCAAAVGADLSRKMPHEDFHKDLDPALFRESLELLKLINAHQGVTTPQLQQIERLLRSAGHAIRRSG